MELLSIIVPCFNEEATVESFYARTSAVCAALPEIRVEYIFVDDGSRDQTLPLLKKLAEGDSAVRWLALSRNFGKEGAMFAGLEHARGDFVAVMDADLQDPPELLPDMVKFLESGEYDSVATRRINREGEPPIRSLFARMFYKLINKISDADIVDGARDYRLMKKEMADVIVAMGEQNRFSKGIFGWIGFRTYWYAFENVKRAAGETKWSFWKLLKYSMNGIVSFSQVPLSIASWMGMGCTGISLAAIVFIVIRKLIFGDPVQGWASNMCVMIFIGGVQLFCLGVIGQYIGKTYAETKKRQHYIVSECSEGQIKRVG